MTSARTRDRLVQRLRIREFTSEAVLKQIRNVPRHLFMDEALASRAYEDTALPIGLGQTISQPYVVARMTEALLDGFEGETVLEIGTGCGYQTAVLAPLVKKIYTVERIPELLRKTRQRLRELDIYNVQFKPGDGWEGWPKYGPYDGIIVTARTGWSRETAEATGTGRTTDHSGRAAGRAGPCDDHESQRSLSSRCRLGLSVLCR